VHIAERHLIPKLLEEHGLSGQLLRFPRSAVLAIAHGYTREAGVRSLSRCCCSEAAKSAVHSCTQPARCACRSCLEVALTNVAVLRRWRGISEASVLNSTNATAGPLQQSAATYV
jgi:ATP-dependent Lon protease